MTDTLDLETPTKLDTAGKRALIENELRADPNRSDREIARVVGHGVDHKTVGAARERMGKSYGDENSPSPEDTPTNRRRVLIAAGEDFIARNPDQHDGRTAEEALDDAVAAGKISLAPQVEHDDDEVVDFSWSDTESVVIPEQFQTAAFVNTQGELVIKQRRWLDEDQTIYISKHCVGEFIDKLLELADTAALPSRSRR